MSKHKLTTDEMKEIADFLSKRSITAEKGQISKSLAEYLESYNKLLDELEEYNKSTS